MDPSSVLSAALPGATLLVYLIVGGLDLGVGLLSLIAPRVQDRSSMLDSLAPSAYGGSTLLAVGAVALSAAFSTGSWFPAVMRPWLALMLLALLARGTARLLRDRAGPATERWCDAAFGLSSGVAILCQGLMLGVALSAISDTDGPSPGSTVISGLVCAAGLAGIYALLGAGWLVWRTQDATRTFGREVGHAAVVLAAGAVALGAAWWILMHAASGAPRPAGAGIVIPLAVVLAMFGIGFWTWRGLWSGSGRAVFLQACMIAAVLSVGVVAGWWSEADVTGNTRDVAALRFVLFDVGLCALVLLASVLRAVRLLRARSDREASAVGHSHAGRRTATINANALHLS